MKKPGIFILLLLFFLFGCTAGGEEPAVPDTDGQAEVLDTPLPPGEATPVSEEPTVELAATEDEVVDRQTVVPVTLDLGQLTPEPTGSGDLAVTPSPGVPEPVTRLVQEMRDDLSQRLGIDVSEIEVVSVNEVTWPDSSLGCPQPNLNYLQVLTPGFQVILEAEGEQYPYHSRDADYFILCERGRLGLPSTDVEK